MLPSRNYWLLNVSKGPKGEEKQGDLCGETPLNVPLPGVCISRGGWRRKTSFLNLLTLPSTCADPSRILHMLLRIFSSKTLFYWPWEEDHSGTSMSIIKGEDRSPETSSSSPPYTRSHHHHLDNHLLCIYPQYVSCHKTSQIPPHLHTLIPFKPPTYFILAPSPFFPPVLKPIHYAFWNPWPSFAKTPFD